MTVLCRPSTDFWTAGNNHYTLQRAYLQCNITFYSQLTQNNENKTSLTMSLTLTIVHQTKKTNKLYHTTDEPFRVHLSRVMGLGRSQWVHFYWAGLFPLKLNITSPNLLTLIFLPMVQSAKLVAWIGAHGKVVARRLEVLKLNRKTMTEKQWQTFLRG